MKDMNLMTLYNYDIVAILKCKVNPIWNAIKLLKQEIPHVYYFSKSYFAYKLLTLKVLNFWKFTSNCSLKPLWSGMGEVVPARTSLTLHPPSPPTVHQLSRLAL